MFIELTDHLRCPVEHDETFLVLLPDVVDGRSVKAGTLGCPVCDRRFRIQDGVFDTGDAPSPPPATTRLVPDALAPLAGLNGPGGYLAVVGGPAAGWREIGALIPGVGLVAVNPPGEVADEPGVSVLRSSRLPLKTHSMRGVVLGAPFGGDPHWIREAARVLLPGLRIVGEGADPPEAIDLMASAGGVWVGSARRKDDKTIGR
ncbi:MAG TPA: hypothetical protein VJQ46_11490 [Gemmatimonadales bacterium]|nr:hypothetical protein [Gemmatimonadales bacterium]